MPASECASGLVCEWNTPDVVENRELTCPLDHMTASRTKAGWRLAAVGAALGAGAVALGAFGAHGLEDAVTPARLETWRTAAQYHGLHALAVVAAGALGAEGARPSLWAARLFLAGIALFSGSLYALVWLDAGWLGAVAPLGGLCLIAGWLALAVAAWRRAPGPTAR